MWVPAPLDSISLANGFLKTQHAQPFELDPEFYRAIDVLCAVVSPFWLNSKVLTPEQAALTLDLTKAAGPPYNVLYGMTKGDVLKQQTPQQLYDNFCENTQYTEATLKDELRPREKEARFFVPSNVATVLVGQMLFNDQNERLLEARHYTPIKLGLEVPGYESFKFWERVRETKGDYYQFDGSQHDAHVPLCLAAVLNFVRKKFLPESVHSLVDRYYDTVYNGYCNVGGFIFHIPMQTSGQILTSSDNSLIVLFLLILHCLKNNVSLQKFLSGPSAVTGDDILLVDEFGCFTPENLSKTWMRYGMFLDTPSLAPQTFESLVFMGMQPADVIVDDVQYHLYTFRPLKLYSSLFYVKRKMTQSDILTKYVALCMMSFANPPLFQLCLSAFESLSPQVSPDLVLNYKGLIHQTGLLNLYTGFQCSFSGREVHANKRNMSQQITTTTTSPQRQVWGPGTQRQFWGTKGDFGRALRGRGVLPVKNKGQRRATEEFMSYSPPVSDQPRTKKKKGANTPYKTQTMIRQPTIRNDYFNSSTFAGHTRMAHSELITTVNMVPGFDCSSYLINPSRSMFAWLSGWSRAFDKWSIVELSVRYIPRTSMLQVGSVYLGFDYDVLDNPPTTEVEISQTSGVVSTAVYSGAVVHYDKRRCASKDLYTGYLNAPEDRWADAGQILVATAGSGTFYAGNLWVDYVIDLMIPQPFTPAPVARVGYEISDPKASHPGQGVSPELWPISGNAFSAVPIDALFSAGVARSGEDPAALQVDNDVAQGGVVTAQIDIKGTTNDDRAFTTMNDVLSIMPSAGIETLTQRFNSMQMLDNRNFQGSMIYDIIPTYGRKYMEWTNRFINNLSGHLLETVISYAFTRKTPFVEL